MIFCSSNNYKIKINTMFLGINTGSFYGIISVILLIAIVIFVLRCFGNIIFALFCYDTCCCEKQQSPIAPIDPIVPIVPTIPNNAIQTFIPFAEVIHTDENNDSYSIPIATEWKK